MRREHGDVASLSAFIAGDNHLLALVKHWPSLFSTFIALTQDAFTSLSTPVNVRVQQEIMRSQRSIRLPQRTRGTAQRLETIAEDGPMQPIRNPNLPPGLPRAPPTVARIDISVQEESQTLSHVQSSSSSLPSSANPLSLENIKQNHPKLTKGVLSLFYSALSLSPFYIPFSSSSTTIPYAIHSHLQNLVLQSGNVSQLYTAWQTFHTPADYPQESRGLLVTTLSSILGSLPNPTRAFVLLLCESVLLFLALAEMDAQDYTAAFPLPPAPEEDPQENTQEKDSSDATQQTQAAKSSFSIGRLLYNWWSRPKQTNSPAETDAQKEKEAPPVSVLMLSITPSLALHCARQAYALLLRFVKPFASGAPQLIQAQLYDQ